MINGHPNRPSARRARRWIGIATSAACALGLFVPAAGAQEGPASDALATQASPEPSSSTSTASGADGSSGTTYEASALPSTLAVDGHGWGHGRGMGQYGSLGYATGTAGERWGYSTILSHFYGGTSVGHVTDNPMMAVLLKGRDRQAMVVYREAGLAVSGLTERPKAVRVTLRSDGTFDVKTGTTCTDTGTSTSPTVQVAGPVRVDPVKDTGDTALRLCRSDGSAVAYRGALVAFGRSFDDKNVGVARTVNLVPMDDLMRGVVPRESPASWGDMDSGRGMEALKTQAVAARSYAAAGDTRWGDLHSGLGARATTCDDTYCQVYGGLANISSSGGVSYVTDPRTNEAVAATANEVRMDGSRVARTEFSSSTGGWTAGGTFPVVVDDGDAISVNPYHHWGVKTPVTLSRSTIEAKYGLGTLTDVKFLERSNAWADMGGRVLKMRLVGTQKSVDLTGNQFRQAFSLRSDWFNVTVPPPPVREPRSIDTACPSSIPRGVFSDVDPASPHARAIDCVAYRKIAEGTGSGQFSPARPVTRGQMASFVARMIEAAAPGKLPSSFPDAFDDDDGTTHELNINRLAAAGVVKGVTENSYRPNQSIDRGQLASLIARALEYIGVDLPASPPSAFSDDNGSVHEHSIDQLADEGVVTGTTADTYAPKATARRDQMASTLARALDLALTS